MQDTTYSEMLKIEALELLYDLLDGTPPGDALAEAVEWCEMDCEYTQTPNSTYYGFSEVNNFVFDMRGYNTFLHGEAFEFLVENDPRLLLNTVVTDIKYDDNGVIITNQDGSCIEAEYTIVTFLVGVLQSGDVTFPPALPDWKNIAIQTFQMGVYTKIFFQFPPEKVFWNTSTEFFLYASKTRGYYPVWQSLHNEHFHPGSGIFFVTVVTDQSYVVDHQDGATTQAQTMVTLRLMFGEENFPGPIAFMYPRWSTTPWAYGSYTNWPPELTLKGHQNPRANVGRVLFAGEAAIAEFYGYLHGAYFEGQAVGDAVAKCLKADAGSTRKCENEKYQEVLEGMTSLGDYSTENGWFYTSFQIIGDVDLPG